MIQSRGEVKPRPYMENAMRQVSPTRSQVALKRLGRKKKTGNFSKIANKAAKKYGSQKAGKRVAGAIYWKMVKKRKGKK